MDCEHKMRLTQGFGAVAMVCTDCGHSTTVEAFVELTEQRCRELEGAGDAIVRTLVRLVEHERIDGFSHQIRVEVEAWEGLRDTSVKPLEVSRTPGNYPGGCPAPRDVRLHELVGLLMRWHGHSIDRGKFLEGLQALR